MMPKPDLVATAAEDAPPSCIIAVEADILVRQPLAAYLRECGYRVLEAMNSQEAIALLSTADLAVAAVLVDAGGTQQAGDGFALASWVRANQPNVQVILSGSVDTTIAKAGELCKQGPAEQKPADHRNVLDQIRRSLAGRARNQH